ncbi:hypothetical protein N7532_000669 [Penicillium argentinense]|uniref:ABC transporter domain-containing protein n=1 Tax=Penicillium argentinense TaxID=1131581 RepID=A0A9W9G611_9EURO|nr:uncharacterized protein N7532_000669 [Penicillium argentinense]KAJ5112624.1 hypothetical protein N7532_000669 [Penicillium argentinense]
MSHQFFNSGTPEDGSNATSLEILPNPLTADESSDLNPASDSFDTERCLKALLQLTNDDDDDEKFLRRTCGISFQGLNVSGSSAAVNTQATVGSLVFNLVDLVKSLINKRDNHIQILHNLEGLVRPGELLVVLGPPGSGCSTFLRTIGGETHGLTLDSSSVFNYHGISFRDMHSRFRGEVLYTAEQDVHFPQLTVGVTLEFAALARTPRNIPGNVDRRVWARYLRDALMKIFGITHTINTKVGNEFVRGVSGGERKRVSIVEAALGGSPFQCWDNSTRGLDSANAIEFCKTLKIGARLVGMTEAVAIYQAPQMAYDQFDKVLLLYQGRQIFFGPTDKAYEYFFQLGFECPERQTTPDFLTSMTSHAERRVRQGFENRVPRTPEQFAQAWTSSLERQQLLEEIDAYNTDHPLGGSDFDLFQKSRSLQQAKSQPKASPYTLSYLQEIQLCLWRSFERVRADPELLITQVVGQTVMILITSSLYYQMKPNTGSFGIRGSLLFFATLINAFSSQLEMLTLYAQRPIVEKHDRYAFYHPSAEAFASMIMDMPYKLLCAVLLNIVLYFMTGLRVTAGAFFFFLLVSFLLTMVMSNFFRTVASLSRTIHQAISPTAILLLALIIYSGYPMPTPFMHGWARWINWVNPIAYAFEAIMINEFHDRKYACSDFIPSGKEYSDDPASRVCSAVGSVVGQEWVSGDHYLESLYQYKGSHRWRNIGILLVFLALFTTTYLVATDYVSAKKSKGAVLVFPRRKVPKYLKTAAEDIESGTKRAGTRDSPVPEKTQDEALKDVDLGILKQTGAFQWRNVCYEVEIKGKPRVILDNVNGWVRPGTLTALMGVSGAGKTTLLDTLASRVTMGVVSGEMLVNGRQRDNSFQRKTGYAQQQDLHLETSTVREALKLSALLRQPHHIPTSEKLDYVDQVLRLLEMQDIADAVVGVPGEGLNVEQRKRLTIGVELVAKPELLLFLDEPTSGLDSQTSWSILMLLRKLRDHGQAILCTVHQPSAILFQQFDQLLLLAEGGRTVYFGPIGESASTMLAYFEGKGGFKCPDDANPAEYMLEVIGAAPGSHTDIDWPEVWKQSPEHAVVIDQLDEWKLDAANEAPPSAEHGRSDYAEFAVPFYSQFYQTLIRIFQQYWRTPSYIYSKIGLIGGVGIFIGFSFFNQTNSQRGLQNEMFSLFMITSCFGLLAQQVMPQFVLQRALYEARERPSKAYSWVAFMLSNILVEIPWALLCAVILFFTWYYPVGLYKNAEPTGTVHLRGAQGFLLIMEFLIFSSTFAHLAIAAIANAETAGNVAFLSFNMNLLFCGVLVGPKSFPHFWIWMYRVSPFNYLIAALFDTSVADTKIICADVEYLHFNPAANMTCGEYMASYIRIAGGYVQNPIATSDCAFCSMADTNVFLESVSVEPHKTRRNFGLLWAYIVFNLCGATLLYWLFRVRSKVKKSKEVVHKLDTEEEGPEDQEGSVRSRLPKSRRTRNLSKFVEL